MLKSSSAMGAATLLSRVLGLAREILYARFMGDGPVAAAFGMAFMIPNLFRRLLGEGALTAAFVPIFKEKERKEGEAAMWRAANAAISALLLATTVIIVVTLFGIHLLLRWDAPTGVSLVRMADPALVMTDRFAASFPDPGFLGAHSRLLFELLQTMFPYLLPVCVAALFMGILNSRGHFFVPAMGATMLNVVMIAVVLWVAPRWGTGLEKQIFALAYGVLAAGVAQVLYQVPTLWEEGYRFAWINPWGNPTVRTIAEKMIPGMLGIAAFQINMLVTKGIAYVIDDQIVASFWYAERLMEFPQGLFGITLATYLLPTLSGLAAEKKYPEFRSTLDQGLGYVGFANCLASILLVVLAEPIVRLLFERGAFTNLSTLRSASAVMGLAPGLIAFSMVNIFARAFYALGDTRTPMLISSFCLVLNIVFTVALVYPFAQAGMGAANSLSAACNVWLLQRTLRRKLKQLDLPLVRQTVFPVLGVGAVAGFVAWGTHFAWEGWVGHRGFPQRVGAVFVPAAVAGLFYGVTLLALRVPQARDCWLMFRQKVAHRRPGEK
jgi:putative peptidoglycan lipid II flippase